jgi:nitrogen fixation/metabolism regulation signal transduction histidine kinase
VSLRARVYAYLVALHVVFAALGAFLLWQHVLWLFAVEVAFVISLAAGMALASRTFRSLGLADEGARLIREHEFTSRFLAVGQPEIDALIGVYNRMVDTLRGERTRLQEQHHFLSHIVRVSPSGIIVLDFDHRIGVANPAAERLLGAAAGELTGRRLSSLDSPLAQRLAALEPGAADVVSLTGARRVRCHHGTFIDRGFTRSFLLVEELTEELRQFERAAYEKLIRVMSHEVNNTVASSNSLLHSSLTYGRELSPASRTDFEHAIGIVIERTEQLNTFMRRFADVFRLPPPHCEPHQILGVLESVVRLQSARPDAAGIIWRWHVEDPTLTASVDRAQFEQALLNVVKNAVDAVCTTGNGAGAVTIRLRQRNGAAVLAIEDTGPGLSAEARENLFTPFFSTKPNGQGIGLTLVQEILAGHGFGYALESEPGGPTRFTVTMGSDELRGTRYE